MSNLILVTPPDIVTEQYDSICFVNMSRDEQELAQDFLKSYNKDLIVYIYNNNNELSWLFNAAKKSKSVYFNIDNTIDNLYYYISYFASMPNVTYKHFSRDFSLINPNRIKSINEYLQRH
jgi:hypothetical protein